MAEEYIGTKQAAKEWGSTSRTIERYIKAGRLKAKFDGYRYKILRTDWETFKARHLTDVA
jgi:excisionase family DNA binding protein